MKSLIAVAVLVAACFMVTAAMATDAAPPAKAAASAPAVAKSATPPASQPVVDPAKTASDLFTAVKNKEWRLVVGLALTLLIWVYRKFISDFVSKTKKWSGLVVALVGVVASFAVELATPGAFSWQSALVGSFLTSGAALTFWAALAKLVLPSPVEKKE